MSKLWEKSQRYEKNYSEKHVDQWGIPFSESYWLKFMEINAVPESALEVGCGNHGLWRFNGRVTGLDPLNFSGLGENFVQGKAEHLPFGDRSFIDVYCVNALDHCDNPRSALREMARVAMKRVVVWCYVFDEAMRPFFRIAYSPHPHCFTQIDLMNLIPSCCKVEYMKTINPIEAFSRYTRRPSTRFKIFLADKLGAHAALLHLKVKDC